MVMQAMSDPASLNLQQLLHLAQAICHTAAITIEPAEAAAEFCYQVALVSDSVFLEGLLNSYREFFEKREELMGLVEATKRTPYVSSLAELLAACESSDGAGADAASDTVKDVPVRWTPYVSFLAELLVAFEPSDGADAACDTVDTRDGKRPNDIWRSTVVWAICHTAAITIEPAEAAAEFCYQVALVSDSVFLEGLLNSYRELFEKREELMGLVEATKRTPYVSSLAELLAACESSDGAGADAASDTVKDVPVRWTPYVSFLAELLVAFDPSDGADAACDTVDTRDGKRPNDIWRSTVVWVCRLVMQAMSDPASLNLQQLLHLAQAICHTAAITIEPAEAAAEFCYQVALVSDSVFLEGLLNSYRELFEKREELMGLVEATKRTPYVSSLAELLAACESSDGTGADAASDTVKDVPVRWTPYVSFLAEFLAACESSNGTGTDAASDTVDAKDGKRPNGIWRSTVVWFCRLVMQAMSDPASLNLQQLLHLAQAICHTAAITIEPAEAAAEFCYQVALVSDSVFLEGLLNSYRELFEQARGTDGPGRGDEKDTLRLLLGRAPGGM
ncbi:uncharacterized protein [Dermacentor albipictus]|uniref:uncharacterized protein isoform X1 n=1 Tax=Dermacentor albipictus TaxID=60249 RepID=UPI0031FDFDB2